MYSYSRLHWNIGYRQRKRRCCLKFYTIFIVRWNTIFIAASITLQPAASPVFVTHVTLELFSCDVLFNRKQWFSFLESEIVKNLGFGKMRASVSLFQNNQKYILLLLITLIISIIPHEPVEVIGLLRKCGPVQFPLHIRVESRHGGAHPSLCQFTAEGT